MPLARDVPRCAVTRLPVLPRDVRLEKCRRRILWARDVVPCLTALVVIESLSWEASALDLRQALHAAAAKFFRGCSERSGHPGLLKHLKQSPAHGFQLALGEPVFLEDEVHAAKAVCQGLRNPLGVHLDGTSA